MWKRLFPPVLDNDYRGPRLALWLLGFLLLIRIVQSVMIIFNAHQTITRADGIPIDSYPAAAAQNVVSLFGAYSVNRIFICLAGIVVLIWFRRAAPLIYAMLLTNLLALQVYFAFVPLARVGTPPGTIVTRVLIALTVVGFVLSLWPRRVESAAHV